MILEWGDESNPSELPKGYHKYLRSYVDSIFLDLAMEEWKTAMEMNLQEFVRDLGSVELDVSPVKIW